MINKQNTIHIVILIFYLSFIIDWKIKRMISTYATFQKFTFTFALLEEWQIREGSLFLIVAAMYFTLPIGYSHVPFLNPQFVF